jgi:hypothetical protein
MGTITLGSHMNGKNVTPRFGWSRAICCIGPGKERAAKTTMFIKRASAVRFHAISSGLFVSGPRKARK